MRKMVKIPEDMPIFEKVKLLQEMAEDKEFPDLMTGQESLDVLMYHILGNDYYITDPVSCNQGNVIVVNDIINHYHSSIRAAFFNGIMLVALASVVLAALFFLFTII